LPTAEVCAGPRVSNAMMRLSVAYTKAINIRYERVGPLFQGAFRARHVDRDEYLVHLSRYFHLNPVRAGLVERPEDWEFSSCRDYLGLRAGSLPRPQIVLAQFPSAEAYREFMASYTPSEKEKIAQVL
jgi:putative transposase